MTTPPWTPPGEDLPDPPPPPAAYPAYSTYPAPPTFAYPASAPQPAEIPPSRTMAGWALGLTIFGCSLVTWVLGVVFAIIVLVESHRDGRDRGRSLAMGALAVAGVWVVVLAIGIASGVGGTQESLGPPDDFVVDSQAGKELPRVAPAKLRVGDCFNDSALAGVGAEDGVVTTALVTLVPCDRLHDFEAYDRFTLDGPDFPGRPAVRRQAGLGCAKSFKPYVGRSYGASDLDFWVYYPTSQSWTVLDDHGVTCVLGQPDEKTAGSLKGSQR